VSSEDLTSTSGSQQTPIAGQPADNYWQVTLAWTEYYQGAWQPKNVTDAFLYSYFSPSRLGFFTNPFLPNPQAPSQSSHVFKARLDGADLVVDMYAELTTFAGFVSPPVLLDQPLLLGEFRFSACGDSVSVAYSSLQTGDPATLGAAESPGLSSQVIQSSTLAMPPSTDVHFNGFLQDGSAPPGLTLATANIGDDPIPGSMPPADPVTFLSGSPSRFELRVSQQDWQFALQEPFFYQDNDRTFFVQPSLGWPVIIQIGDPKRVDLPGILVSGLAAHGPATQSDASPAGGGNAGAEAGRFGLASVAAPVTWAGAEQAASHNWSAPTYLLPGSWLLPTTTLLAFQTHRHPYVCDLIQDLVAAQGQEQSGGISGLLNIGNQNPASSFSFEASYNPVASYVPPPWPAETIEFSAGGAYADYNWELFFHAPLLVALTLSQNQQFADADAWFRYIFNPTDSTAGVAAPDRFWQVQPFRAGVPQTLLQLMQAIDAGDPSAIAQVTVWKDHPFEPFPLARLRNSAFQKYVFMAYLDNLIAWGDYLYGNVDTVESVNQATQLYVYAAQLLGELPMRIPSPQSPVELSYSQIRSNLDAFSNFVETVENEFPYAGPVTSNPSGQSGGLLGLTNLFFFCIPPNQKLLQYWSTVAGRLYNIRNCLNLQGLPQTLAPYPSIANPLASIEAAAEGIDPGSVLASLSAPLPNYRFGYLIAKAAELTGICQSFGKQLLDALEKNDAEGLALLRASQEITIQNLIQTFKQDQLAEAQANVQALMAARNVPVARYTYYQMLLGNSGAAVPAVGASIAPASIPSQPTQDTGGVQLISEEQSEMALSGQAAVLHAGAGLLQVLASIQAVLPNVSIGTDIQPFGVGTNLGFSFGGSNLASSTEARVHGMETQANYLTYQAWAAGKMGGYFRRQQEWTLQSNLAAGEIMQIDQQINAANLRVTVAQDDLAVTAAQAANAQAAQAYLQNKFTNQQLYTWMVGQVSSLYSQLYQLAYASSQQAEIAYQRELGVPESNYITFGYWDSLRKGLLAGERLQLAIRQLELAYLNGNQREFEITRYVSLLLHDPAALMSLKTTGQCVVTLPEQLFDLDYPGHYLRRLRDVSLTIPCVAGPYTNLNCTLTLVSSKVRFDPATGGSPGGYAEGQGSDPRFIYYSGATAAIATSHAQDDSGVFTVNFRDERYLPFETAGVISTWMLTMPPACNALDMDTITDVVFKLSYTSRYGGDLMRSQAFAAATLPALPGQTQAATIPAAPPQSGRDRLFSVKHEFPSGWYGLLHPSDSSASYGQLPLWITPDRFPFQYRGRKITTADIEVFALLSTGATMTSLTIYLTQAPFPPPASPPVPPAAPAPDPATDGVSLGARPLYGTSALYGVKAQPSPSTIPQLWWLSIGAGDLSDVASQVEDFFVMFHYSVA
jgi:Tc toxin complex TcA C-terminal TcB-binding domain